MKINLKIGNRRFYFFTNKIQLCTGALSKLPNGKHIIMWDLEDKELSLDKVKTELKRIQKLYHLSNIYITSDRNPPKDSFQAWCFTQVSLKLLIEILLKTQYVDWQFIKHTVKYERACLRCSTKIGREQIKVIDIVPTFKEEIPQLNFEYYETGAKG